MARRVAVAAFWLLLFLQPAWHLWLHPPTALNPLLVTLLLAGPLLLPAIGLLRRRRTALFWGGIASLLHFCHGISEAWTDPSVTAIAMLETGLACVLILAIGVDGLSRRRAIRAAR